MDSFSDFLILVSFFLEVAVLFYLELKAWGTLYTPLNFLMLPFALNLLITLLAVSTYDFVPIYYSCLMLWSVGLLLFAVPSITLGCLLQKSKVAVSFTISEERFPKVMLYAGYLIALLLIYRLYSVTLSSAEPFGSEDFGVEYCGTGLWGHLRLVTLPILIMAIYYVDKRNRILWPLILLILFINFMYQVKGWVIIPCIAGLAMRLYSGKLKLNMRFFLYVIGGALLVFLITYVIIPILGNDGIVTLELLEFVLGHFFHYLTSGILGLSIDAVRGFPDSGSFEMVLAPFINIGNQLIGSDELLSPVNPYYYNSGITLTNVRTLFGTLYIYSNYAQFAVYTLVLSCIMYGLRLVSLKFNSVFLYVVYFFECSLLFMGWFEFYFFHLAAIEIPIVTLLLMLVYKVLQTPAVKPAIPVSR